MNPNTETKRYAGLDIKRLTIDVADQGGDTIEKSYLVSSSAQAAQIQAAAKLLGFTVQIPRPIAPDERLFSGRSSREGDYCFELLTIDELRRFLLSGGVETLETMDGYEHDGCRASACIECVGTAEEIIKATRHHMPECAQSLV